MAEESGRRVAAVAGHPGEASETGETDPGGTPLEPGGPGLRLNTHVHVPPNFSAFATIEDAVEAAAGEGLHALGASNFHDLGVYDRLATAARSRRILPLFGIEIITVLEDASRAGQRVNDPENPGRAYLCGKGIPWPLHVGPLTARRLAASRALAEARARRMFDRLSERFTQAGLEAALAYDGIARDVAERAGVPLASAVLQERHLAEAFQEALFRACRPEARAGVLERAFGGPATSGLDDPLAVQTEIRSRLMKAGRPAFEPESPIAFEEARELILGLGALPCYPILADGANPMCEFEAPASALPDRLHARGIHAAELIPLRNAPEVVDDYVSRLRAAGIIVMAGTEHNTRVRISLRPRCLDGSLPPPVSRAAFEEATCVVAAHQHLRERGEAGYVDGEGRLAPGFPDTETRIRWFRELGEELIVRQRQVVEGGR